MEKLIGIFLPVYILLYFGVVFVARTVLVGKRIGKNPFVFPKDESAYALVGFYFKLVTLSLMIYAGIFPFHPLWIEHGKILWMNHPVIHYTALIVLVVSFGWTMLAQHHMRNSWRIGIDQSMKTELVTSGLFAISRNPTFLGMLLTLAGIFLLTPNTATLIFLVLGYVLIQLQVRMEESHLLEAHGQEYERYKNRVSRFI